MTSSKANIAVWLLLLSSIVGAASATDDGDIVSREVAFADGETVLLHGVVSGKDIVDYTFDAKAAQYLQIYFNPSSFAAGFYLLAPEPGFKVFSGSNGPNQFEGELRLTGTYSIRIYLQDAAADRNVSSDYELEVVLASEPPATRRKDIDPRKLADTREIIATAF